MTTPNHLTPDGSITNYGSWSTVQHRTREEWEAGEYQKWATAMAGIPKIGDKLAEIPVIGGALSDFWEIITGIPDSDENDAGSMIRGFFDSISSALSGTSNPNPGDSFLTNIWQLLGGLSAQSADNAAAIQQLENLLQSAAPTPSWVSNLTDMATVPRALLIPSDITGSTGSSDGSGSHSHSSGSLKLSGCPSYKPVANNVFGNSTGTIYFTPIVADRTGQLDKLRFITGADSLLYSIDEYYLALFGYNPMNGNIEKLWQSSNLKEDIGSDRAEIEISMGLSATVQPAQVLFVAHMQRQPALGGSTRTVAAVPQGGVSRPSSVLLRASCYELPGQTGIAASYALSSLSLNNNYIPWYAISVTN
ncbi:minor tail protein [Gordonia phage SteamedHams]|nr:minor tail protein [Gordonia phage SteamedHams]